MTRIPPRFAVSLIALSCAVSAAAQDDTMPSDSDDIVVTGQYLSFDELNAVKTPTPIIDVPQSVSIVTESQIEDQFFTDFGDVFRYTPGVAISQGEGHRDAVIIRGQQSTADFFLDAVRDDVQYFRPFYNLERVEILRGANALLFGRGGTGGIVNRVSKTPDLRGSFTTGVSSVDTFGSFVVEADINRPLDGIGGLGRAVGEGEAGAGLRLNAFYERLENHRDVFDGDRFGINPTVAVALSPRTRLDLSYEYLDDDRVVDRGVPSVVVDGGPNTPLEGFDNTFFGDPDANFTTLQANIARARIDHDFNDSFSGNLTAKFADYDKLYQNLFPSESVTLVDGVPETVELDGYRDATDRQNFILQGNLVGEFQTGSIGHTLLIGGEYIDQDTENSRIDNVFSDNGDDQISFAFSDPLSIPAFAFTNPVRDRASDVEVFSAYVQDEIELGDKFRLLLGGRYDRFDISVADFANDGEFNRVDEEVTPRLGAIYKPMENVSVYASYSESFLPRSGDQFLTLNLDTESTRPQSTENREIGVKWDIRPNLSFTAALFDLDRESFTSVDPEDQAQLITIDGAETRGVELQLTGQLTPDWYVAMGYSYLDSEVEDLTTDDLGAVVAGPFDGNDTRQTPENIASIWTRYQLTDRFGLGAGATYQDSVFVREDNSVEVPDFIRFDAAAYYDVNPDLRLQVNVENVFDTDYFPDSHSNTNISTGAPLNARFTVIGSFG